MQTLVNVFPLFSSPLAAIEINGDFSKIKKSLSKIKYREAVFGLNSSISRNLKILDEFPEEKELLLKAWYEYKDNFLYYDTTDFEISTSWITKTAPGGYCQFHNHRNCFYSAVFYFDEVPGGTIEFDSMGIIPSQITVNNPSEWTLYNCKNFEYSPSKNDLIFFPSYVYHRVNKNTSDKNRYSLAFNIFPVGKVGEGDSFVELELQSNWSPRLDN